MGAQGDEGDDIVPDEKRQRAESQTCHQPDPPALPAPVILHLDDERVADADAQELGGSYDDSFIIHTLWSHKVRNNQWFILGQEDQGLGYLNFFHFFKISLAI